MSAPVSEQLTRLVPETGLLYSVKSFLLDGESRRLSPRRLSFYRDELRYFRQWVEAKGVQAVESLTPDLLRRYLLHLGETRNPGGQHAAYRTLRAFLRWYQREYEPEGWRVTPSPKSSHPSCTRILCQRYHSTVCARCWPPVLAVVSSIPATRLSCSACWTVAAGLTSS